MDCLIMPFICIKYRALSGKMHMNDKFKRVRMWSLHVLKCEACRLYFAGRDWENKEESNKDSQSVDQENEMGGYIT
jgi:hypothetical protein